MNKNRKVKVKIMCHMFEKVTGRKTIGNVEGLKTLLLKHILQKDKHAIIQVPVEYLEIDTRYQTDERTERDLQYLTKNWSERKLLPLVGVPHWNEGKIYIVDGYGRWIASQIVDPVKYKYLDVLVLLDAPEDPIERLKFEAEEYAYQNRDVAKVTPIQKHGAMIVLHDPTTEILEQLKRAYGFEYVASKGVREASVLGSYTETLSLCRIDNGKAAEYVFDICAGAGFDRKANGYSSYVMRALRDIYKLYVNDREDTKQFLVKELRKTTPLNLKANAVVKYPMLDAKIAVSLYVEDMVVNALGLAQSREVIGTKVVMIRKPVA